MFRSYIHECMMLFDYSYTSGLSRKYKHHLMVMVIELRIKREYIIFFHSTLNLNSMYMYDDSLLNIWYKYRYVIQASSDKIPDLPYTVFCFLVWSCFHTGKSNQICYHTAIWWHNILSFDLGTTNKFVFYCQLTIFSATKWMYQWFDLTKAMNSTI